jgi:hypothetical protein
MKTGQDANRSGRYISECCLKEVGLQRGQMCPRCPKCYGLTVWEFVKSHRQPTLPEKAPASA